jgi:predicted GNAT family N-acyltransferase
MRLQNFQVVLADWSHESDQQALLEIRQQVFVVEQGVPESRERDGLDPDCWHVLACDEAGLPIGCARMSPQHKIGRMAVMQPWRGQGVGAALLRELVARARAMGWREVSLAAQVSAIGFYIREGFVAYGEVFDDAGLPHRSMTLDLPVPVPADAEPETPRDIRPLPVTTRHDVSAARLQLLEDTRHRLCLHLPLLTGDLFTSTEELAQLRRIAISGRRAQVRILLHDPAEALRHDHRLIALVQRLSSAIQVRMPIDEADFGTRSSYLLNDAGGYLFQPAADQPRGRAARLDRAVASPLQQEFDELWDRSQRASVLQTLNI